MAVDLEDYSLARVIKGIYDSEYKTIATDDEGNIIGIFKGQYGTTLHTIKVDSEGRMLAIITDPEDVYGNIHMVGNAELAARLGSLNAYDRRGNTVWMDDFEDGINKWVGEGDDDTYSVVASATHQSTGGVSCKLSSGSGGQRHAKITHANYLPVLSKIGLEYMILLDSNVDYVYTYLYLYVGTTRYRAYVRLDVANNDLDVADGDTWREVDGDLQLNVGTNCFYPLKVVADYSTGKYVRLLFGEEEYNISTYTMKTATVSAGDRLATVIQCFGTTGQSGIIYVDNVIITQNEP